MENALNQRKTLLIFPMCFDDGVIVQSSAATLLHQVFLAFQERHKLTETSQDYIYFPIHVQVTWL